MKTKNKLVAIKTVSQARALPLAKQTHEIVTDEFGNSALVRNPDAFFPKPTEGHQMIFFEDADGTLMEVVYGEDGPAKRPFP